MEVHPIKLVGLCVMMYVHCSTPVRASVPVCTSLDSQVTKPSPLFQKVSAMRPQPCELQGDHFLVRAGKRALGPVRSPS